MAVHFLREVDQLKQRILALSAIVETQLHTAIKSLHERNRDSARIVIERDAEVDQMEVAIEEECLKILALYQPVTGDLRFIIAVLKINNDLERIGDLSVNIARKAVALSKYSDFIFPFDLNEMAKRAVAMVEQSLDALVQLDSERARKVCSMDESVNKMKRNARRLTVEAIKQDPQTTEPLLRLLAASRNLERIADLATNIAEDVIYMVEGHISRHGSDRAGESADQLD